MSFSSMEQQIRGALRGSAPLELSGKKRASVALLLRRDSTGLEVLFIKRAVRKGDRWSGDVAMPGGKKEQGETDFEAVVREVLEEVGLDLRQEGMWEYFGHLNDRTALELTVRCHVFLQLAKETPALRLEASEVAACSWCPLDHLCRPACEVQVVGQWPIFRFDRSRLTKLAEKTRLLWSLGLDEVCFNAIDLPLRDSQPPDCGSFRLWGLTLRMINDFLLLADLRSRHDALEVYPCKYLLGSWKLENCACKHLLQNLLREPLLRVGRACKGNAFTPVHSFVCLLYVEVSAIAAGAAALAVMLTRKKLGGK